GKADAALEGRQVAEDGLQQGRLSGAIGPDDAHDLARADIERDLVQDLQAAVAGAHALDGKHQGWPCEAGREAPSRASITFSSARIWAGGPSAIFSPWSITTTLSQRSMT